LKIPPALDGERIDRAIALLAGLTRSQSSRLVTGGCARIAGEPVLLPSRRLRAGETLEVDLEAANLKAMPKEWEAGGMHPASEQGNTVHPASEPSEQGNSLPAGFPRARVVYSDADVVVVDKPAGLVVHPGAGNPRGTLVDQLVELFPDILDAGPDHQRPGIVQRLDKGTSGLLVVARTAPARAALTSQLSRRTADRRYLAVVHGRMEEDEGAIEAPLGRSPSRRVKMAVVQGGRPARTQYSVRSSVIEPIASALVACKLETGRTHQVRAHFAAIGHPLLADEQYAAASLIATTRRVLPDLRRPWLHAGLLGFAHPATGEAMRFTAPLPADLSTTLGILGFDPDEAVL